MRSGLHACPLQSSSAPHMPHSCSCLLQVQQAAIALRTITRFGTQCRQLQASALYFGGQAAPIYKMDTENNTAAAMMVSADAISAIHKKIYMDIGETYPCFAGKGLYWDMPSWSLPSCSIHI